MKVLWITNILFPEVQGLLTGNSDQKSSGGWMLASADALLQEQEKEIELVVACVNNCVKKVSVVQGKKIKYYILPYGNGNKKYNPEYEQYWKAIKQTEKPDIVHIHGTEFSHGTAYVKACGNKNVVVSIQGLVGEIGKHYCDGLSRWDIYKNITLRDIFKGTCFSERNEWIKRGEYERELISSVSHIIGRTEWDKAHVWSINPEAKYYHCDETLRDVFYSGKWDYKKCTPHSIFVSQAYYPIKGLHQVLKALPLVIRHYPDTILRIAGSDITHYKMRNFSSYFSYLEYLINKHKLSSHIEFCGPLTSEEMKKEYLKANVFVCPSAIENSSNALSEAQILNVPSIASFVGGLPTLMKGNENWMYRFDDYCELSHLLCSCFLTGCSVETYSSNRIRERHDPKKNIKELLEIYNCVADGCQ